MYEYELMNTITGERIFMWGKVSGEIRRKLEQTGRNPAEWTVLHCDYID